MVACLNWIRAAYPRIMRRRLERSNSSGRCRDRVPVSEFAAICCDGVRLLHSRYADQLHASCGFGVDYLRRHPGDVPKTLEKKCACRSTPYVRGEAITERSAGNSIADGLDEAKDHHG